MNQPVMTPAVIDSLYVWLCERAAAGEFCPGNQEICDRYSFKSMASAAGVVKRLEQSGKIEVTRFNRARLIKIVATGKCTVVPKVENKKIHVARKNTTPSLTEKPQRKRTERPGAAPTTAPGPRGRQCQWIEGEPTETDACKCLVTTTSDSPYCFHHKHRAHTHAGDYVPAYMKPSLKGLGG